MELLAPLGLIGLIGIPLLILIYIIKPKYHERTISSTYVWKLSQKYRKRKNPFDKITQSLLLIIQIIVIGIITMLVTQPFFVDKQEKADEQVFVLDASASMNAKDGNGVTRYEKAIDKITEELKNTPDDMKTTVIFADSEPYYLAERESDKNYIKHLLETTPCTFETADYNAAIRAVTSILEYNSDATVKMYTDHHFEQEGYIDVIDLSEGDWNVAIQKASIEYVEGYYEFETKLVSYNRSSSVVLELELEDVYANNNPDVTFERKLTVSKTVDLQRNRESNVISFQNLNVYQFSQAKFTLKDSSGNPISDAFDYDNEFYTFGGDEERFDVQIISETGSFIEKSIRTLGTCDVQIRTPEAASSKGYDLYIYDQFSPQTLPSDGMVWIINPAANKIFQDLGFSTNSTVTFNKDASGNYKDEEVVCVKNVTPENDVYGIMDSVCEFQDIKVTKYTKVTDLSENYQVCMSSSNGDPLIFAGKNGLTNVVVMAFDLHYSDLPITLNMPILIKNMLDFTVRRATDTYKYDVGEVVTLNVRPDAEKVTVIYNGVTYEYTDFANPITIETTVGGVCNVLTETTDKELVASSFFVKIPDEESDFSVVGKTLGANSRPESNEDAMIEMESNKDLSIYFAIGLLALLLIEWGVQYREQY